MKKRSPYFNNIWVLEVFEILEAAASNHFGSFCRVKVEGSSHNIREEASHRPCTVPVWKKHP